jgi:hypothetical protein
MLFEQLNLSRPISMMPYDHAHERHSIGLLHAKKQNTQ